MHINGEFDLDIAGLHFIGSNFSHVTDESLQTPIGFNIIFPGMIGHAISMGLNLPMCQSDVDAILSIRDLELNRYGMELLWSV